MVSSKIVVDSVHGDITPNDLEWRVIDTATFQRLRKLKQLQMAYLVYPNATHTRFAHSLGVFNVMKRVLEKVREHLDEKDTQDLRLAALMHDIGHYPYSHLLEGVDKVILTEEHLSKNQKNALTGFEPYPDHELVGKRILDRQEDIKDILGERTERIGNLFSGEEAANPQLSKLIHSSLDMDRLDYLIRDSQATGVPYGMVDINYLLNHIKRGEDGTIGITHKAIAAAEHLLLARSFLFRVVCQHKTVYGLEETARQLLRRLRDRAQNNEKNHYNIPIDGNKIFEIVESKELFGFEDSFLDKIFISACEDNNPIISGLAKTIVSRRPPRLIWEKKLFVERKNKGKDEELFKEKCKNALEDLAKEVGLDPRQFLICILKPIGFEARSAAMSKDEAKKEINSGEISEMIQVFKSPNEKDPVDIVEIEHSILNEIGGHIFRTYRLYLVHPQDNQDEIVEKLKNAVKSWNL